jgi:hypothetical protein
MHGPSPKVYDRPGASLTRERQTADCRHRLGGATLQHPCRRLSSPVIGRRCTSHCIGVLPRAVRPAVLGPVGASGDGRGARDIPRLAEARVDGGLRAAANAVGAAPVRRWVRIWSITDAWVMNATMRIAPWQVGHASGSTSKSCCRRAAQRRLASVGASRGAGTIAGAAFPPHAAGAIRTGCPTTRPSTST